MATGRTYDVEVFVGTGDWLTDMTDAVNSVNVAGTTNVTRNPVLGRREENALFHTGTHSVSLPQCYVGAETDALRSRQGGGPARIAVLEGGFSTDADENNQMAYIMDCILTGLPESSPTTDAITTALTFPQADKMWAAQGGNGGASARCVYAWSFATSNKSITLRNLTADEAVFCIFAKVEDAGAYTFPGGINVGNRTVGDVGIEMIRAAGTAATAPAFTKTANLAANKTNSGYLIIAEEVN